MKLNEVAAYLGRSDDQVRRYRKDGLRPSHKIGKELYYDRTAVMEFAKARGLRTVEPVQPADDIKVASLPIEQKRSLAAQIEGLTRQYDRQEIDYSQFVDSVRAASGRPFGEGSQSYPLAVGTAR